MTPTPGAASELLPRMAEAIREIHIACFADREPCTTVESLTAWLRTIVGPLMVDMEKAPAPVTEGAQREAVAWVPTDELVRYQEGKLNRNPCVCFGANIWSMPSTPLYTAPPPPDRVQTRNPESSIAQPERSGIVTNSDGTWRFGEAQPERVEAGAGTAALRRVYEAARRYFRNEAESAVVCTNNLNRIRDAIEDVKLIDGGYEPAPPTDASGGVTEAMVSAAITARGNALLNDDCRPRDAMRAALEAADRARKQTPVATQPVDASAQAASAGEAVLERDCRVGAGVIRAGCKVSTLIDCAERNQEYYLRDKKCFAWIDPDTAPTPDSRDSDRYAAYREVTLEEISVMERAFSDAMRAADNPDDAWASSMLAALRSIGAVIRTTDAPTGVTST